MEEHTPATKHRRRTRYKGRHPRRFEEKYKEHDPGSFPEEIRKVVERGATPAGTHRPICVAEILEILAPEPGQVGLDATLGYGGHALELLRRIVPGGRLYGLEVDPIVFPRTEKRLRDLGFTPDVLVVKRMNFAGIRKIMAEAGGAFDFVLADLGVSSMQMDDAARGFSFKIDGPLDLRFNPSRGKPAWAFLESLSVHNLGDLLRDNADEPHSQAIATAVVAANAAMATRQPDEAGSTGSTHIRTTGQLQRIIAEALSSLPEATRREEIRKAKQRTFQALRIAVNDEFIVLEQFLQCVPFCLRPGGRIAILTFHSGEDRRVKKSFRTFFREGIFARVASAPIRPSPEERRSNPRSSSAKLRWAEKA